jgi:hypothetical protein
MKALAAIAFVSLFGVAQAQEDIADGFTDAKDGGKVHIASGFICPAKIDLFERDAVGEKDSESGTDFCAYSALDGTYGTITLTLLKGPYDPKAALAPDFMEQEGIGGKRLGESTLKEAGPLAVYTRTYETSKLESLRYSILFTGAAVGNWAVETTIEYADPRDNAAEKNFLNTVYVAALKQIARPAEPTPAQTP